MFLWASQVVLVAKNPPAHIGHSRDSESIPGLGRFLWRRKWQPTPVFLRRESHGQRSLEGCSSWDHTELNTHAHTQIDVSVLSQLIDFFLFQFIWSKMTASDTLPEAAFDFKTNISFPHLRSAEKYKLKQWYTTTHLLEWPKSNSLTTPTADQDGE